MRFISLPDSPPSDEMRFHLRVMLNPGPSLAYVDSDERLLVVELYERILGVALRDASVRIRRLGILHTIFCEEFRIDIPVLADLTRTDHSKKLSSCYTLCSTSQPRTAVSIGAIHHFLTFSFLLTETDIQCILRCIYSSGRPGPTLCFNMFNLPSSYLLDSEVDGLMPSIDGILSLTRRYATGRGIFFMRYLQKATARTYSVT